MATSRIRRWLRWSLIALALLLVLVVVTLVMAVRSLDAPWLKTRLQTEIQREAGVEADWSATRVSLLSGLELDGLVVKTPPAMRARAPELLRVDALKVTWTVDSLLGHGTRLGDVILKGVALNVVRDQSGTSLAQLGGPVSPAPSVAPKAAKSSPLSHLLADFLRAAPPLGRVQIDGITLGLVEDEKGQPERRFHLGGLALSGQFEHQRDGWRLQAQLGDPQAPLELAVERQRDGAPDGQARARLSARLGLEPARATVQLDAEVLEQTLMRATPIHKVAHLEAEARFDVKAGRVNLTLKKSEVADGAATVEAELELPDAGPILLHKAEGRADGVHLLRLIPEGWVPAKFSRAELAYRVEELLLDRTPRFLPGGSAAVEGELAGVRAGAISAGDAKLLLAARPDREGGARVHVDLRAKSAELPGVAARDGHVTVEARELHVDREAPLATRGQVEVGGELASLDVAKKKTRIAATGLRFTVGAHLKGAAPYNIDGDIPVEALQLSDGPRRLFDGPAHVELHATDVWPDALRPPRSRAKAHVVLSAGPVQVDLTADKHSDSVDYKVTAQSTTLGPLKPFLSVDQKDGPPWDKIGATISSTGRVDALFSREVRIQHHTEAHFDRPSFGAVAMKEASLTASSEGSAKKISGEMALRWKGTTLSGTPLGDGQLGLRFAADVAAPSPLVKLNLSTQGADGLGGAVDASFGFDRARHTIAYQLDGHAGGLSSLAPFLVKSGLGRDELSQLEVTLRGQGNIEGLVESIDANGRPRFLKDPLESLLVLGTLAFGAQHLQWAKGDQELSIPKLAWQLELSGDTQHRTFKSHLELDALHFAAGDNQIDAKGITDDISSTLDGALRLGVGSVEHKLTLHALTQDFQPDYAVGELTLTLRASRDKDGVIKVPELALDNRAAGSALHLKGGLDLGGERRSLTLIADLQQDLGKLWSDRRALSGRGTASVSLRIASGNLRLYHATGSVKVAGADIRLPSRSVAIETMDGEIPLSADLLLEAGHLKLVRDASVNTYSELRYSDQHPLFHSQSFISVKRVSTPLFEVAPLEGSLRIEHNVVSLSQFETGFRQGRVTGQCIIDSGKNDAVVHLHLRASHVMAKSGEPFDGNAAVVLSMKDRGVEGRAEILRIGRRHLLDLLDLDDPHHADPGMNKIRKALSLGYPDQVRLSFSHGFANAKVTFGGLARLISIGELRGIPMGPLIDKVLAPLEAKEDSE
jgi:hypothetical protein